MVANSKILTVSYGTFSCTLEGFDDPFSAMRSIAEYFRDLAAEDRFFGAEPPTPDAETLARLAQLSSARRVTARVGEHGVSLTEAPGATPRRTAPADAVLAEAVPAGPETPVTEAPAPVEAPARAAAPAADEDVVARLQRIRAAAARNPAADAGFEDQAAAGFAPITAAFSDVLPASGYAGTAPVDLLAPLAAPSRPMPGGAWRDERVTRMPADRFDPSDDDRADDDPIFGDAHDPDDLYDPEPVSPASAAPVRLVRARLVRRRPGESADSEAPALMPLPEVTVAPARALPQDPGVLALTPDEQRIPVFPDIPVRAGIFKRSVGAPSAGGMAAVAVPPEESLPPAAMARTEVREDALARSVTSLRPEVAPGTADQGLSAASRVSDDWLRGAAPAQRLRFDSALPAAGRAGAAAADPGASDSARPAEADLRRERLRPGDDAVTRLLREANSQLDDHEALRRRSTIAHLKAAVAATRAEPARSPATDADQDLDRYRDDLQRAVRGHRPSGDRRLAPLMLVSEQRVDVPARSAAFSPAQPVSAGNLALAGQPEPVAHAQEILPAAAAAEPEPAVLPAAEQLPHAAEPLSDVMVSAPAAQTTAPVLPEPPEAVAIAPAMPAQAPQSILPQARGFAGFVSQMGASTLPELIEAAAAYACFIENRPHLTRPQLMELAQSAGGVVANREDGLRAFGTLLRKGIIRKTKRGQFSVSETTRFRPV